ncbi:aspartyl/asparaginyl beta-hydroxylase domain-containing protein [Micromonospora sp. CPCC 206060]|uniref:aspartyl/asparaginyl beta-hydroxylase domain-containing protein n=1 Tax=Micromonospora sp. CPCC 206060 TaxID=3122406 RepID=UPI002FEEDD5F
MFLDPDRFPFLAELPRRWAEIRDEYLALPEDTFEPWVQREMYGHGWSVYGLVAFGTRIEAALASCPRTADALAGIPGLTTAGFSRMAPGTHIRPHEGWVTTVYRTHLGLVVPGGECAIRVGRQTRSWHGGGLLVFDDTVEHEAWNRTTATRAILLLDFTRPGQEHAAPDVPPAEVARRIARRQG